jgi:predicted nucleotidyltransferase
MKLKNAKKRGKPDPVILADIVRRIVAAAKPEKILLFGSAARGEMGPNSDYDLLVIKDGKFNRHQVTVEITRALRGLVIKDGKFNRHQVTVEITRALRGKGAPADVVVVRPDEVERYRDSDCLVICPALREGKVVYDAQTLPAG